MALTRRFKDTVARRLRADPAFADALLREAVQELLAGDLETGKAILRDHVNAGLGFVRLGELTKTSPKSLMRMLGPKGNPQAHSLLAIIAALQRETGVRLKVTAAA